MSEMSTTSGAFQEAKRKQAGVRSKHRAKLPPNLQVATVTGAENGLGVDVTFLAGTDGERSMMEAAAQAIRIPEIADLVRKGLFLSLHAKQILVTSTSRLAWGNRTWGSDDAYGLWDLHDALNKLIDEHHYTAIMPASEVDYLLVELHPAALAGFRRRPEKPEGHPAALLFRLLMQVHLGSILRADWPGPRHPKSDWQYDATRYCFEKSGQAVPGLVKGTSWNFEMENAVWDILAKNASCPPALTWEPAGPAHQVLVRVLRRVQRLSNTWGTFRSNDNAELMTRLVEDEHSKWLAEQQHHA
jgi:hypothetical protein